MRFVYPAVFHQESENEFSGYFPDLKGISISAPTLNEAIFAAIEAGSTWITTELEDDGDLPPVSDKEDLTLREGDMFRNISMIIRLTDGWDE